jgi:hypothetical protein
MRRAWGCGFDDCTSHFRDWSERCNHIAIHFSKHYSLASEWQESTWRYSNIIRNLLRQTEVAEMFDGILAECYGKNELLWPELAWQNNSETQVLRLQLEYRDFRAGLWRIAKTAFELGCHDGNEQNLFSRDIVSDI